MPTSRLTLPPLIPKLYSLLPSPVMPPAPTPLAGSSLFVSSADVTSSMVIALPPDRHDPSLASLSPIGSLIQTTQVIVTPLMILMTLTATTTRVTSKPHPPD